MPTLMKVRPHLLWCARPPTHLAADLDVEGCEPVLRLVAEAGEALAAAVVHVPPEEVNVLQGGGGRCLG